QRLATLVETYGFVPWSDIAIVLSDVSVDRLDAGTLDDLLRRLMLVRTASWRRVLCLCILAEQALEAGCPDGARRMLAVIDDASRAALLASEIRRLEGELVLQQTPTAADEAERTFRAAIDIARSRSEKGLELRAETSLGRLLAARGRRDEARRRLGDVYGSFTEGFATRDLRVARALLAELDTR